MLDWNDIDPELHVKLGDNQTIGAFESLSTQIPFCSNFPFFCFCVFWIIKKNLCCFIKALQIIVIV